MRLFWIFLAVILSVPVHAQDDSDVLRVVGMDTVMVTPDMGVVSLRLTARAQEAAEARRDNEVQSAAVFAMLQEHGIAERHVRVVSARVSEQFERIDDVRVRVGFIANQIVTVTVMDLDVLPGIIEGLFETDDVQLSGISYDISDRRAVEDEGLRRAIAHARHKADLMANETGVRIYGVRRIIEGTDNSGIGQGIQLRGAGTPAQADTPLPDAYSPGQIIVRAVVTVEYRIMDEI